MKKQILFLSFLVLAVLAGVTNSWAQEAGTPGGLGTQTVYSASTYLSGAPGCVTKATLECASSTTNGPLNPLVGEVYNYSVEIDGALTSGSTNGGVRWYVTDDPTLFSAIGTLNTANIDPGTGLGSYIMTATASYNVPIATHNTNNTVSISWKAIDPAKVVLLVAYVVDDAGCTDNIEVYRIQPEFKFRLNIAALTDGGVLVANSTGNYDASECVSPIESATYDVTTGLTVNYGENWVFFVINAADFADSWMPTFQLTYTGTAAGLYADWAYPTDAITASNWHPITEGTDTNSDGINEWTTATPVIVAGETAAGNGKAANSDGECIIVRVRVDHGTDAAAENDVDDGAKQIKLAVDGILYDGAATGDKYISPALAALHDTGSGNPCAAAAFTNDWAGYTLTPRPAVSTRTDDGTGTTNAPFATKNGSVNP